MKTRGVVLSIIAGVAAGAAAGAALGILYAPDKGTETRRRLMERGGEIADNVKSKVSSLGEEARKKFQGAREEADDLMEKGKSKIYEAKSDLNSTI